MIFTPVPAGTPAAQALILRGAEHDILVDATHISVSNWSAVTKPVAAPGAPADRLIQHSLICALLGGSLFTEDLNVLLTSTAMAVVQPNKLDDSMNRYIADGFDDSVERVTAGAIIGAFDERVGELRELRDRVSESVSRRDASAASSRAA